MTNQTTAKYNIDDVDDLTRFANESFDTDEVDLFQFTGDESSPLTKLKSVILSLDWDITDEYLQELADELAYLAPSWQDDRVASLYLQGMGKIGKYLRLRGAHAHPNSIKLLLTYFHHFETILASPDMSGESITTLVQNDIRKFKVLQYQIKLKEEAAAGEQTDTPAGKGLSTTRDIGEAEDALRNFKAAILELDWEVSDHSLARFASSLKALGEEKIQNKSALILIQGMQALGQYISDERAQAHPEVFNLLHAFHDGLEQILDEGPTAPDRQQIKTILIDRVNRLNHLKKLIAPKESVIPEPVPIPPPAARPEPVVPAAPEDPGITSPARAAAVASLQSGPAVSADENLKTPALSIEETVEPALFTEEDAAITDREIVLAADENLAPEPETTLLDETTTAGISLAEDFPIEPDMDEKQPADAGTSIESEIDALFAGSSKRAMLSSKEEYPVEELPITAYTAVDDEVSDGFIDHNVGVRGGITPALAGIAEEPGLNDEEEEFDPETRSELDEQFDFFFGESEGGAEHSEPAASLFDEEFEEPVESPDPLTETAFSDGKDLQTASGESAVFSEDLEIEELLQDGKQGQTLHASAELDPEDDEEVFASVPGAADAMPAALADAEPPEEAALFAAEEADEEITSKLDSFFDLPDADSGLEPQGAGDTDLESTLAEAAPEQGVHSAEVAHTALKEQEVGAAASYAAMPAALADAQPPEEADLFALEEPDPAITGKLDSFFDLPDTDNEVELQLASDAGLEKTLAEAVPEPAMESAADLSPSLEEQAMQSAASYAAMPAALTDAQPPEEVDLFALEEADPAITGKLDSFFDLADADDKEQVHLHDTGAPEENAIAQSELFAAEQEEAEADVSSASTPLDHLFEDIPAALTDAEPPASALPAEETEEEREAENLELQGHLDSIFELPEKDLEPTAAEFEQLAVLPEQDSDDENDDEFPQNEADTFLSQGALADVDAPALKRSKNEELDPQIEQLLDSFLDDKADGSSPAKEALSREVAEWNVFTAEQPDTIEEPSLFDEALLLDAKAAEFETAFSVSLEEETEPLLAEPAVESLAAPVATEDLTAQLSEEQIADSGDKVFAGVELSNDSLELGSHTAAALSGSDDSSTEKTSPELALEGGLAPSSGRSEDFEDILDSSEVQEFLLSGQDIEDIPDEELEFADETVHPATEAASLAGSPPSLDIFQAEDIFADASLSERGDTDNLLSTADDLRMTEDKSDTDVEAALAPDQGAATETIDEFLLAEEEKDTTAESLFTDLADEKENGEVGADLFAPQREAFATDNDAPASAITALGALLPALLSSPTAEHLDDSRQHLRALQAGMQLSSVQHTAAAMLDTVLAGLPRHAGGADRNVAMVESLYQALAEPQEHLPLETMAAYTEWMRALLSEHLFAGSGSQPSQEYFTARDIYQELSGFRTRMEEELAQIRREIQNK